MRSLISFFTRIPAGGDISDISSDLYLITLLAVIISLFPLSIFLIFYKFVPRILLSLVVIVTIYAVTGLLHLDGLADFSDGVMKKGKREDKIKVLKDPNTGVSGTFSVIFLVLAEFYAINAIKINILDIASFFVLSEISGKLSMLSGLTFFKSPESGLAYEFKKGVKNYYIIAAIAITFPLILIFRLIYLNILTGIVISLVIGWISINNFGFVNGDALGAMNEISRVVTMWLICLGL